MAKGKAMEIEQGSNGTALAKVEPANIAEIMERVLLAGDLGAMAAPDRVRFYMETCRSMGLNPLTRPFEYMKLNGKTTLYAKRDCTDQLRKLNGVSVTKLEHAIEGGVYTVTAYVQDKWGRVDSDLGAVPFENVRGEARANATMKAVTKAKRRATLSICGLGIHDESELESIPGAVRMVETETGELRPVVQTQTTRAQDPDEKEIADFVQALKDATDADQIAAAVTEAREEAARWTDGSRIMYSAALATRCRELGVPVPTKPKGKPAIGKARGKPADEHGDRGPDPDEGLPPPELYEDEGN